MIGGIIVQVLKRDDGIYIEVLDEFDRSWRICTDASAHVIEVHDRIWWQSYEGRLNREDVYEDHKIGSCRPAEHPDNELKKGKR